ncbi:amino acid adenylation domain-containing protein, partial [Pseudoalteromonas sp. Ld19]|uniref:amino acid adenylation domain-containing protein n=2 Tax=unclassified Pseudoalteromonas TaxID=194690 RepID=UPI00386956A1
MSVELLFQQLQQAGVIFKSENDKITLKLPKQLDNQLKQSLASNKDALKTFLKQLYGHSNKKPKLCKAKSEHVELSFAQQRLWVIDQLQGSSAEYNMPQAYQTYGELDLDLVEQVFTKIISRHEILRTVYLHRNGEAIQKVQKKTDFCLSRHDLSGLNSEEKHQKLEQLIAEDAQTPFDLSTDLMLRVAYVNLGVLEDESSQHGFLLFNMHHIASDGWSMAVLSKEFFILYASLSQKLTESLPELPIQYRDYAQWQREWLHGDILASQLEYWRIQLADLPALHSLPLSYIRPNKKQYVGGCLSTSLPSIVANKLQQLAQQHQLTSFMVLHAALALALSRFSTSNDIVVGTPIANRSEAELQTLIGFFVNSLVLRVNTLYETLDDYLNHVRSVHKDAQSNQDVPFEQIVETLNVCRDSAYSPLFQIVLTTNSDFGVGSGQTQKIELSELTLEPVACETPICKFDLELNLSVHEGGIDIHWTYDKALFKSEFISRLNNQLNIVLERMAQSATKLAPIELNQVSALHPDEQDKLQHLLQTKVIDLVEYRTITELFESSVTAAPDSIALVCAKQAFTYGELDRASNRLGHYLTEQGYLNTQKTIGLLLPRSAETIVAMLAVLKVGCAYVPLNPDYPQARLDYILEDAQVDLVITIDFLSSLLANTDIVLVILNDDMSIKLPEAEELSRYGREKLAAKPILASDPAYVIYTSGSTGYPKGVVVPHRAVSRLVTEPNFMTLNQDTVFLQAANVAFDAATLEIWGPLLNGGKCVIYPQRHIELKQLNQLIAYHNVNSLWLTSGLFSEWSKESLVDLPLQYILAGGDVLESLAVSRVQAMLPKAQLINGYGPTENTTFTCCYSIPANFDAITNVPIGLPLRGDQVLILNENSLVPYGCIGELCVSGAGLALGYLNKDDLTQQSFVNNPIYQATDSNIYKKLYRSGDLVRYNSDGIIEYMGRVDDQIKIRGFRVELGEIEQQITQLSEVTSALVVVSSDHKIKRLVAYVELSVAGQQRVEDGDYNNEQLACELKHRLPDYMVPSAFVTVTAWPLTNNGKIDRKALPKADFVSEDDYQSPKNKEEKVLVEIWSELLAIEQETLSTKANFFALGGHSLLIIQLIAKLKERDYKVDTQAIFACTSLAVMAELLQPNSVNGNDFQVPDNLIPSQCDYITPEMLNLIDLSQSEIDEITAQVSGGVQNVQDIYPLAPLQQGMLAIHTLTDGRDPYVTTVAFEFSEKPLLDILLNQLNTMIARHDVLRTGILWRGRTEAVQVVLRSVSLNLEWLPVSSTQQPRQVFQNYVTHGEHRIELESSPLMQLQAMNDNGRIYVVLKVHHLLIDHVSLDILMEELALLDEDQQHQLPDAIPYRHFIARVLHNNQHQDNSAYFHDILSSYTQPAYPFGLSEVNGNGTEIVEYKTKLSIDLAERIRCLAQAKDMSPAAMFHLAWAIVIAACAGQKDVVFGTVLSGRFQGGPGVERMLGMMINTLPFRVTLAGKNVLELLSSVNEGLQSLLAYEQASLSEAMRESGLEGNIPLFSAVINYRHSHDIAATDEQTDLKLLGVRERTNYPFVLSVDDLQTGFALNLQVDNKVKPENIIAYMITALEKLVLALTEDHNTTMCALSVVHEAECYQLLSALNDTQQSYQHDICIHELFEAQAAANPTDTALHFGEQTLSYGELNAKANQLAHYLRDNHHVGPESLVGLCVERSLEMVIGIWGILKAGGAYVPLDPALPSARLQYLVNDANTHVVLSVKAVTEYVELSSATVVLLDQLGSVSEHQFS